jgi:hypothetical protein
LPKDTDHKNTVIENNLVLVTNGDLGLNESASGLTFSKNLLSKKPDSSVVGAGDIIADPQLVNPTQSIDLDQIAHPVNASWYIPTSSSPAIGQAIPLSYVTNDFLGAFREIPPDIGALESTQ